MHISDPETETETRNLWIVVANVWLTLLQFHLPRWKWYLRWENRPWQSFESRTRWLLLGHFDTWAWSRRYSCYRIPGWGNWSNVCPWSWRRQTSDDPAGTKRILEKESKFLIFMKELKILLVWESFINRRLSGCSCTARSLGVLYKWS